MSCHHRNTEGEPSVLSILAMLLTTSLVIMLTAYVATGPDFGPREVAGFALGVLCSAMLLAQTTLRAVAREAAEDRKYDEELEKVTADVATTVPISISHRAYEQATQRFAARYPR